ncbi:hypothetical protein SDJN02_20028, partial [Cucurbita argyrosperma subsp. argyrosperma]
MMRFVIDLGESVEELIFSNRSKEKIQVQKKARINVNSMEGTRLLVSISPIRHTQAFGTAFLAEEHAWLLERRL